MQSSDNVSADTLMHLYALRTSPSRTFQNGALGALCIYRKYKGDMGLPNLNHLVTVLTHSKQCKVPAASKGIAGLNPGSPWR